MRLRWILGLAVIAVAPMALGQGLMDERAKKSDIVLGKVRQLDLLNQILPILMTKEQLNKILPPVEKARQAVRNQQRQEHDQLIKLEPGLDKAIKDANEKGLLPEADFIKKTYIYFRAFAITRKAVADENTANVIAVVKVTLNPGQIKSMENSLSPQSFDPTMDPAKMTSDEKLRFFVQNILLDPMAYDVLLKLATGR